MKQAKKFLALLAAAALAMTLLAGCTVRPGPDGNVIIVPDDEEEYIPAPPVVTMPEDVGTIVEGSEKQLNGYHETTYKSVYENMKKVSMGKTYYLTMEQAENSGSGDKMTWAKYESNYYLAEGDSQILIIDGQQYVKETQESSWREATEDEQIPGYITENMFTQLIVDFGEEAQAQQWSSAKTTNGFDIDYYTTDIREGAEPGSSYKYLKTSVYCWDGQLARYSEEYLDENYNVVRSNNITYYTQTTLPASVEALLKNPPIITPAPVN